LTELGTALVWAGVFAAHGASWEAVRGGIFLTILFGIAISDARFYIIPDQFSVGGAAVGLATSFLPGGIGWTQAALGAAVGYGALWLVGVAGTWVIRRIQPGRLEEAGVEQALGGGDIKMMMMVVALAGTRGVVLTCFLVSHLALRLFGAIAPLPKRLIPLGVFLAAAAGAAYAWGDPMVSWYMTRVVGQPG